MNRAHRLADQFRNVVGWLGRTPTESQFVQKGFLTPAEFVEAGDQLVYQCPSWQWQSCPTKKNQVLWLPANKQYLITHNIPCRHRVGDWDNTLYRQSRVTCEGWLVPGPQPPTPTEKKEVTKKEPGPPISQCTVKIDGGAEIEVRHQHESSSSSESEDDDDEDEEDSEEREETEVPLSAKESGSPETLKRESTPRDDFVEVHSPEKASVPDPLHSRLSEMLSRTASQLQLHGKFLPSLSPVVPPCNSSIMEDDYCLIGGGNSERKERAKAEQPRRGRKKTLVPTRCYDLSITYDKYYQSPRLWLFGYDESGVPLRADAVFEDIHSDYLSKTVTVDPHPFTGVPTVSVHPCKHATVMKTVAQNWLRSGVQPRHDLALFVLLKMVSSVVPTINYDFTIDIEMPLGLPPPRDLPSSAETADLQEEDTTSKETPNCGFSQ